MAHHYLGNRMTADRNWMEQLGFALEDNGSTLWVVVDDCGGERPASLAEIVLWTYLTAPPATVAPAGMEDPVTVPRGLLGAACAAISKKADAPNTLAKLREFTVGSKSAAPAAPAEPTHLRRADGTLSGVFIEPVASGAATVAADLRNWLDFLPGHAQPTIERAVRLLETRP